MLQIYDIVDLADLTAFVRDYRVDQQGRLSQFLPAVTRETIDYEIVVADRANDVAMIRAFDTPATQGRRPGARRTKGELPSVSQILTLSESESLRLRRLMLAPDQLRQVLEDAIFDDAAIVTIAVENRLELLRAAVLTTGQITIDEGGYIAAIPMGVPGGNIVSSVGSWLDPTYDIATEMFGWQQVINDAAGESAAIMPCSTKIRAAMMRNQSLQKLAGVLNVGAFAVPPGAINAALEANGLPLPTVYDRKVNDATGARVRVWPENKVALLPAGTSEDGTQLLGSPVGQTQFGITAEAAELVGANQLDPEEAPGLVGVVLKSANPVATHTLGTAIALPVLSRPEAVFAATVF